jgi:hypothetical protein
MTLKDPKPPRCLTVSTGETVPNGQSVQARMWNVELRPDDVDVRLLTGCQRDAEAGLYAECMSAFLMWLAPRLDEHRESLKRSIILRRSEATQNNRQHRRSPLQVANLQAGFELFLCFAREKGAIIASEWQTLAKRSWRALLQEAERAVTERQEQDPCRMFLAMVRAAIISGAYALGAEVSGAVDPEKRFRPLIGWRSSDGRLLLLEPELAFAAAQRMAAEQKRTISLSPRTLYRRLEEGNLLAQHDRDHLTKKWQIGSTRRRVLCLRRKDVLGDDGEGSEPTNE